MKYHLNRCLSEWLMGATAHTTHWKGGLLPPYRSYEEVLTEILPILTEVSMAVMRHCSSLNSDTELH